ncbi:MAG: DUF2085 domain-containing protein [Candidatus Bathyarchaeia archaeon]
MSWVEEIINFFNFIGGLVCHQKPERTLVVGGYPLPVCARDTGAYIGLDMGYITLLFLRNKDASGPPNLLLTLVMSAPLYVDSFGQFFRFWTSNNDLRLFTGILFGMSLAPFLVYTLSLFFFKGKIPLLRRIQPKNADLNAKDSWFNTKAIGANMLISILLFTGIKLIASSGFYLFYWLLSIPIISGVVWHFFILLPLLVAITLVHYFRNRLSIKMRNYHGQK